jgi:hypothetical protein
MDNLIDLINMNWLCDVHVGCEKKKQYFFFEFMDVEDALMMDNEKIISIRGFL